MHPAPRPLGVLLHLLLPAALAAQDGSTTSGREAHAARVDVAPVIDGRMEDEAWSQALGLEDFVQREPVDGRPVSERTVVRLLYDDDALYIGAWLYVREPSRIVFSESRRDADLADSDAFRILLDTYLDRQNGFVFGTTPAGIEYDGQVTREGQGGFTGGVRQQSGSGGGFNLNWDGSWQVATTRDTAGWYAEFRIPFSTLRYARSGPQRWGINFSRSIRGNYEEALWSPVPRQFDFHRVSMAGILEGIEAPAQRPITVTPYVLGSGRRDYVAGSETDVAAEVGGDAKIGLTQSLTLDLTVNTDFAQVEVDDDQINLTRFRLFFPEKRPFFLENAGTFAVGTPQNVELFFSRRIGIEDGQAVPIVGGARMTGRVGGLTVGLLNIQTDALSTTAVGGEQFDVAPAENFGVVRVLRELPNRSRIGGIAVSRVNTGDPADANFTFAVDGRLGIGEGLTLDGYVARSQTPDIHSGELAYSAGASYTSRDWEFGGTFREVGEGFNPEAGFLPRSAYRFVSGRVLRHVRVPGISWLRELRPHMSYSEHLDLEGFSETRFIHIDSHVEFANGAFFQLPALNFTREGLRDPFEISPGIVIAPGTYDNFEWGFEYHTNESAPVSISGNIDIGGFYSGRRWGTGTDLNVRLGGTFAASLGVDYYDIELDEGAFETTLLRLRTAYSFSPSLYLQALLQYNDQTETFSSNLRFGWLNTAGTGLFLVYNDIENTGSFERVGFRRGPLDRTFVVKYTRQFDFTR